MTEFIDLINKNNILYSLIAGVLSAIIAGLIFFLFKEIAFKKPEFNGRFFLKVVVSESTKNSYKGMEVHFLVHFSPKDNGFIGGGERIYEDSSPGMGSPHVIHYTGDSKIPMRINGEYNKKIFLKDDFSLMCEITSKDRVSHMVVNFKVPFFYRLEDFSLLEGNFTWSVANKSGIAYLSTSMFSQKEATHGRLVVDSGAL
ncbi:hypothetical protein [uncultured Comamonas sp.]|uniref:hypothetical protein n=1 Tax=uncultured Comamonas sp. TaxID=114710 RepID=UPI0025EFCD51|nr:hypothetical protein [uncultured Comamonas sp.]